MLAAIVLHGGSRGLGEGAFPVLVLVLAVLAVMAIFSGKESR